MSKLSWVGKVKLKKSWKKKWLRALRSGEFEQGTGMLEDNNSYCCWGVLCNISGYSSVPEESFAPVSVCARVFETGSVVDIDKTQKTLAAMNDKGKDFNTIADFIERSL